MSMVPLPRVALSNWRIPLHELPGLSATLGGPRIFVKRDDLTGLALGGNKCRKLEYVLANAQRSGVDTLITSGSSQSNFALQMAAAARKLGMEPYLVLVKGIHVETQGNLLLYNILNSTVSILEVEDPSEMFTTMPKKMEDLADELRSEGRNPLVIPAGAFTPLGTAGWVNAAEEMSQQLQDQKTRCSLCGFGQWLWRTQAGLTLRFKQVKLPLNIIGISVLNEKTEATTIVVDQANETAKLLGFDVAITPDEVALYDDYIGQGYGIPTKECIEAIRMVAQTEAIFLDPVYTGKAMAGLVDLINTGHFTKKDTVLFVHTGGVAADFAYSEELSRL
ncbi:MAG: D-cysteine desulfhydrase family protein [Deltaproteobacteria bacterium]|nr:MAG: D-cysteine desulfhydrase family protein [Deltaproteobacteria bacterium]